MSRVEENNKFLVRRFIDEVYNKGNLAVVDELLGSDFHLPDELPPGPPGREPYKKHVVAWRAAFPDLHVAIEDMVAEGDKVVYRWNLQGTHRSEFMGVPPTGRELVASGIVIFRVANGRIVEAWQNYDSLRLFQQLGLVGDVRKAHSPSSAK